MMDQNIFNESGASSAGAREELPNFGNPVNDMNQPFVNNAVNQAPPTFNYPAQPQYAQPAAPQQPATHPEVEKCVDGAFSKGLAATIMAWFPVASIIAIFFGATACSLNKRAVELGAAYGVQVSGKNVAAKILGKIGNIAGIVMTCFWAFYFLIIFAAVASM